MATNETKFKTPIFARISSFISKRQKKTAEFVIPYNRSAPSVDKSNILIIILAHPNNNFENQQYTAKRTWREIRVTISSFEDVPAINPKENMRNLICMLQVSMQVCYQFPRALLQR